VGLNAYRIPDSSDEFNQKQDLAKFSHLPGRRNPWRDPWWFRWEFTLPAPPPGRHIWLHCDCLNYRAEAWLNGQQIADTFLDGSRVVLRLDGRPVASKWAWARAGRKQDLAFPLQVDQPGQREVTVGERKLELMVTP
jgi:hypothetical protein